MNYEFLVLNEKFLNSKFKTQNSKLSNTHYLLPINFGGADEVVAAYPS